MTQLTIDNTKKVLCDLQQVVIASIDIFQHKTGFSMINDIMAIVGGTGAALNDGIKAWPELKDLTPEEAAQLGTEAFNFVTAILKKIKEGTVTTPPAG